MKESKFARWIKKRNSNRLNVQRNASGTVQFSAGGAGGKQTLTPVKAATDQSTTLSFTRVGNYVKAVGQVKALGETDTGKVSIKILKGTSTLTSTTTTGQNTTTATLTYTANEEFTPIVKVVGTGTAGTGSLIAIAGVEARIAPKDTVLGIAP